MACRWAMLIGESAYKTPETTLDETTVNLTWVPIRIVDGDGVAPAEAPNVEQLYTAEACGQPDITVGETIGYGATIKTLLYPEQAQFLLSAFGVPVDKSGTPDIPFTTTEPAGDLASYSLVYFYEDRDGVDRKLIYTGGKVDQGILEAARGTRDGAFQVTLGMTFSEVAAASQSEPAAARYPTLKPYHLSSTNGGLTLNGEVISNYESLRITVDNTLDKPFDEATTISYMRVLRRQMMTSITSSLKFPSGTPEIDWRALYLNQTTFAGELVMTHPGNNHRVTIDLEDAIRATNWAATLPLGDARKTQTLDLMSRYNHSAGRSFGFAFSDPTP